MAGRLWKRLHLLLAAVHLFLSHRAQVVASPGAHHRLLFSGCRARALLSASLAFFPAAARGRDPADLLAEHVTKTVPAGDVTGILRAFTSYSAENNLGMELGEEKGALLEAAVRRGLPAGKQPAVVFEAGCHAGDGTLSALAALEGRASSVVVSTEANEDWLAAAKRVVGHAIAGKDIAFLPAVLDTGDDFAEFLEDLGHARGITTFDAVILDHDESLFLPYLKTILSKGMLQPGATVYVDNVVRKATALKEYIGFVSTEAGNGFDTEVQYITKPYKDAVAISTYNPRGSEL